jgi:hypothetical protein
VDAATLVEVAVVDVVVVCRCRGRHTRSRGRIVREENDRDASRQSVKRDVGDDAVCRRG